MPPARLRRCLFICAAVIGGLLLRPGLAAPQAPPGAITVFAASDLGPAFRQIIPAFERATGAKVTLVPGSTGTLTQQIRNGAPADLFFAANAAAIDDLIAEHLTLTETRVLYARGQLVLAALKAAPLRPAMLASLADPAVRRIAIANPAFAPYGLAAQQALQAAGLWTALQPKLIYGENVQQAVQFVQSGSVDAGLVARSSADDAALTWTLVDPRLYAPLNQTAIVLARTTQPAVARAFMAFVTGAEGRAAMKPFGFLIPGVDF